MFLFSSSPSESPLLRGNGHLRNGSSKDKSEADAIATESPLEKRRSTKANDLPRFANGQSRQITRSVSAFDAAVRRTQMRLKNAVFLRTNSTANTASVQQQRQGTALQANWSAATADVEATVPQPPPPPPSTSMGADMKLAPILFGVVIVFVLCNR